MSKYLKHHTKKIGLPPGSLVHTSNGKESKVTISVIDFDEKRLIEKQDISPHECIEYMISPATTWIHICGINDLKAVETIGNHFHLHPLILEDIVSCGQRCKIDTYQDHLFIVMQMLSYNGSGKLQEDQVSLILGKNYVISFVETQEDIFNSIRQRIRKINSRIRQMGADYLMYSLLDVIVDNYFVVLEKMDLLLEGLEEELTHDPSSQVLLKIQQAKRNNALLRKSVWPMREVINQFQRVDTSLVSQPVRVYLSDVYDHAIQAIDTIEGFRDIVSGLLEMYISNINLRMNEIMKVLTVMSTIFVPLTFIASIYGMNFDNMPELHSQWGYPTALLLMFIVAIFMMAFFRRKKWI